MLLLRLAMHRFWYVSPEVESTLLSFFLLFGEDEPVECKVCVRFGVFDEVREVGGQIEKPVIAAGKLAETE